MSDLQPHIQLAAEDVAAKVAILVGDPARLDHLKDLLEDGRELAYNREFRSIHGSYKGVPILGLSTGVGAPSAAIAVEELGQIGVQTLIRVGSAGAYQSNIGLGSLAIGTGVVREDGLSAQYVPKQFPAVPTPRLLALAKKYSPDAFYGLIRSHDGFYMDDNADTERFWSQKGVLAADMESSALMVVGQLRGLETLSILNNVVLWEADVKEGVNDLVHNGNQVKDGETASLQLALDILSDKGGRI